LTVRPETLAPPPVRLTVAVLAVTAPPKSEMPRTTASPPPGRVSVQIESSESPAAVRIEPSAG
jgi:hypothetical protein